MAVTLEELKERMKNRLDEITLLEVLDIKAEDIVERFEDKIDERYDTLVGDFSSGDEEEEDTEEGI